MKGIGFLLVSLGVLGLFAGFAMDGSVAGLSGRVANIDLMNFKLLLVIGGSAALVSGCTLVGAAAVCQAVRQHSTQGAMSETAPIAAAEGYVFCPTCKRPTPSSKPSCRRCGAALPVAFA